MTTVVRRRPKSRVRAWHAEFSTQEWEAALQGEWLEVTGPAGEVYGCDVETARREHAVKRTAGVDVHLLYVGAMRRLQ